MSRESKFQGLIQAIKFEWRRNVLAGNAATSDYDRLYYKGAADQCNELLAVCGVPRFDHTDEIMEVQRSRTSDHVRQLMSGSFRKIPEFVD